MPNNLKVKKIDSPNVKALYLGADYISKTITEYPNFYVERRDLVGDRILVDGNTAAGLGAVYGGASVVSWYPITPSTSLVGAFEDYAKELRVDEVTGKIISALYKLKTSWLPSAW